MEKKELKLITDLKSFLSDTDVEEVKKTLLNPEHSMGDFMVNFELVQPENEPLVYKEV